MQDKREIPAIVNEKIVIIEIFTLFVGGTSLLMVQANRQINRSACLGTIFHPLR